MFPNRPKGGTYIGACSAASITQNQVSGTAGSNAVYTPAITFTYAPCSVISNSQVYIQIQESVDGVTWSEDNIIALFNPQGGGTRTTDIFSPVLGNYYRVRLKDAITQSYGNASNTVQLTEYYIYENTYVWNGGGSDDFDFVVPAEATVADFFIISSGASGRAANNVGLVSGGGGGGGAYAMKIGAVVTPGDHFYVRAVAPSNSPGYIRRDSAVDTSNQITVQGGAIPVSTGVAGVGGTTIASSGIFASLSASEAGADGSVGIDPVGVTAGTGGNGGASGAYLDGVNKPPSGVLSTGINCDLGYPNVPTAYGCGGAGIGSNGPYDDIPGITGYGGYIYVLYRAV